jgi:hypothetical protein
MSDRSAPPNQDPLLTEILAIAASRDREALRLDITEPAFVALVDRAVAPYERALTAEGLAKAREMAIFSLATRTDIDALLERERARIAESGVQSIRNADRLAEVAHRKRGTRAR